MDTWIVSANTVAEKPLLMYESEVPYMDAQHSRKLLQHDILEILKLLHKKHMQGYLKVLAQNFQKFSLGILSLIF